MKEINENDIKITRNREYDYLMKNSLKYKLNIDNYFNLELSKDYFEQYCKNYNNQNNYMEESCQIFISIIQGQMSEKNKKDSQYIITTRSSKNKGKMLISGNVYQGELKPESKEYSI